MEERAPMSLSSAIQRACMGDPDGFERLYEHYKRPLGKRLLYLVSNEEVAYDLYQETFIRVWQKIVEGVSVTNFEAWLYRIARNVAIDYLRRKELLRFLPFPDEETDKPGTYMLLGELKEPCHEEYICEMLDLKQALEKMSPQYRVCILLQELWGASQKEIAQTLGISESTVSANVSRGFKQLRQVYSTIFNEPKARGREMRKDET